MAGSVLADPASTSCSSGLTDDTRSVEFALGARRLAGRSRRAQVGRVTGYVPCQTASRTTIVPFRCQEAAQTTGERPASVGSAIMSAAVRQSVRKRARACRCRKCANRRRRSGRRMVGRMRTRLSDVAMWILKPRSPVNPCAAPTAATSAGRPQRERDRSCPATRDDLAQVVSAARLAHSPRWSSGRHNAFVPTLRDAPGGRRRGQSHKLLVRGGFIRQVGAGSGRSLPLGWRVHRKVEQIVREEMDAIGGAGDARAGADAARAVGGDRPRRRSRSSSTSRTAPGAVRAAADARGDVHVPRARDPELHASCRSSWYHFQTKDRDEPRPRGGLLRVREFIMKDAYSFDRDEAGLDDELPAARRGAYHRIFERCGLEYYAVEAESGMMGGSESIDFLAPSGSGENTLVTCENGDYAADLEVARGVPRAPEFPPRARRARGGRDAGRDDDRGARRAARDRRRPRRRRRCR